MNEKIETILASYGFQKNKALRSYIRNPKGRVAEWKGWMEEAGVHPSKSLALGAIMANNDLNGADVNVGDNGPYPLKPNAIRLSFTSPYATAEGKAAHIANLQFWVTTVRESTLEKWARCLAEIDAAR